MKKLKIIGVLIAALVIILEVLPRGAVLNFGVAPGEGGGTIKRTFSYFDPTPFGYANFGPLMTAVLSCAIFLMLFILLFIKGREGYLNSILALSCAALLTSLMPLCFGLNFYSVAGLLISLLLAASVGLCILMKRMKAR